MFFIGQEHITLQLGDILPYIYHNKQGISLLFRGPSGYGKTELAKKCCNFLVGDNYVYSLGNKPKFNNNAWVHFIDEVHLMENPEVMYPLMDLDKFVFIFATNFDSVLPEALSNRCKNYTFVEYSTGELIQIFRIHSKFTYPENVILHIIDIANRNPRIMVKTFIDTLKMHYKRQENIPSDEQEIIQTINRLFGIDGGLDRISREYLDKLQALGGRVSLDVLSNALHIDKNTIKYQVEPGLLYKKLISVTSRGREII